jgi:acetylornithine deacetylase/succinyl-diaminopimelate desuccinylase-like protein
VDFLEAGLVVEIHRETHNGVTQANVIARPQTGRPADELMLQTHLDTAEPGAYALWTKTGANPFNASIYRDVASADILYGLGSAQCKLDFLCKLEACKHILSKHGPSLRLPFVLCATFGEELGMPGAVKIIRKKLVSTTMALIGEPTDLRVVQAGKGFAGVEIVVPFSNEEKAFRAKHDESDGSTTQSRMFMGKAAHSAMPQMGDSAITKLLQYLAKLPEGLAVMNIEGGVSYNTVPASAVLEIDMVGGLRDSIGAKISRIQNAVEKVEKKFQDFPDAEFDPNLPTLNVGLVRTYEDFIKFSACCRMPPSVNNETYEKWMRDLREACEAVGGQFRVTDYKQPFRTATTSLLLNALQSELKSLGQPDQGQAQSVTNEANVFSRFGIECIVWGPGQGVGNSHAPNEHVRIEQLHLASKVYLGVLERVCL